MPVEFIGFIGANGASEIHRNTGPVLDVGYVEASARARRTSWPRRCSTRTTSASPRS